MRSDGQARASLGDAANSCTGLMLYLIEQFLNGIQLGMLLFLLAAGLTLIFGIMDLVNLAHGSLYMIGAYFAATFAEWTGSFVLGALLALAAVPAIPASAQMTEIAGQRIRAHVKFLASDLLEGRGVGARGGDLATEYIAAQFALTGAKPAGDNGTYFQNLSRSSTHALRGAPGAKNVAL